jgi:hypothetical protein
MSAHAPRLATLLAAVVATSLPGAMARADAVAGRASADDRGGARGGSTLSPPGANAPAPLDANAPSPQDGARRATRSTPDADPDLARLGDGHSLRTNYSLGGTGDRYGRAEILVDAPIDVVRKLALDFGHYKEFTAGRFHTSRVVGKTAEGTDVYFQISLLDGMINLWQVFRFQELAPLAPGWVMVEGWCLKGNIGRGNAAWTLHAKGDRRTVVSFDLFILPNVPLPQSLLDEGLRNAAGEAVEAIRDRAEASRSGADAK